METPAVLSSEVLDCVQDNFDESFCVEKGIGEAPPRLSVRIPGKGIDDSEGVYSLIFNLLLAVNKLKYGKVVVVHPNSIRAIIGVDTNGAPGKFRFNCTVHRSAGYYLTF